MRNIPKAYFISGVCGAGKTSVLEHLQKLLPVDRYDIHDFDERGVPDGGGPDWHNSETLYWLDVALRNAKQGTSTIIGGFANPERFKKVYQAGQHPPAHLFLLHASGDTLRQRLYGRYPTPESIQEINRASGVPLDEFVLNNISFAPELRLIFEKAGFPVIDTDALTSEEVAREIIKQIGISNIAGIGALLETPQGTFLFQERDQDIQRNPGKIAPFGGATDANETPIECAIRELKEELNLRVSGRDLQDIGILESRFAPGTYIQMFLVQNVRLEDTRLHEGKSIKEMSIEEALDNPQVTDFTKEALSLLIPATSKKV